MTPSPHLAAKDVSDLLEVKIENDKTLVTVDWYHNGTLIDRNTDGFTFPGKYKCEAISTPIRPYVYIKITQQRLLSRFDNSANYPLRKASKCYNIYICIEKNKRCCCCWKKIGFYVLFLRCFLIGEKYGSSSFRKKLKLARIGFDTAGTYRIVARGKYCQFEKKVEVRVISKYYDNSIKYLVYQGTWG